MSITLVKGQKVDVTKTVPGLSNIVVRLGWSNMDGIDLDASAFLLGPNGKVLQENDFVFYSNPSGGQGSVVHSTNIAGGDRSDKEQISIDLLRVPSTIQKVAFTITIYDAKNRRHSFGQVSNPYIRVSALNGAELFRFDLGNSLSTETAIVVGELYRHNGEWKFNAIGSGFNGGLAALCNNFGVEVEEEQSNLPPAPVNQPPTPPPPPPPTPINLAKIELKKKGDVVSLKKTSGSLGEVLVNLNWNQKPKKHGIGFLLQTEKIDLDLGCLYELTDGYKGCIQALGNNFGYFHDFPYIALDGDDRTGSKTGGENLRINGKQVHEFRRILIYAYIYEGVAKWAETDGVVTIKQADNPDIEVKMDVHDPRKIMCAVAMIERQGDTFSIKRLVEYFSGHEPMDRHYDWNMNWRAGSK
ncbi:TerD family protein [Brevibacillus sp. SYSU BS000544]|uniref:TerD family protein n=1 Tax=Brevibacillus sp. SYSU BS000544 TaxID=3416443 RepID=UPI003CE4A572